MKKSSLARMQQIATELEQINDNNVTKLIEVLEAAFSAIATAEPKIALHIIEQMNAQVYTIKESITERRQNAEEYVKRLTQAMPSHIELEDEDDGPSEMN